MEGPLFDFSGGLVFFLEDVFASGFGFAPIPALCSLSAANSNEMGVYITELRNLQSVSD